MCWTGLGYAPTLYYGLCGTELGYGATGCACERLTHLDLSYNHVGHEGAAKLAGTTPTTALLVLILVLASTRSTTSTTARTSISDCW
eukprot:1330754-Rhodomonas_salina.5